jgi:uncharacterized integral membrane protein
MATEPQPTPEPTAVGPGPGQGRPRTDTPSANSGSRGTAPAGAGQAAPPLPQHTIKRTRVSGVWIATLAFAVVLLLLLVFILENSHTVDVSYFGAHGHLPLGVALLLAAVFGVLLVALPGTARIIQLRGTARRHRRADAKSVAANKPASQDRS